jgi:hypothetical protein
MFLFKLDTPYKDSERVKLQLIKYNWRLFVAVVRTPQQARAHCCFKASIKTWWLCELLSMKGFFCGILKW